MSTSNSFAACSISARMLSVCGVLAELMPVWQRHRRPIRRQIGVHDVALRRRLIGLIQQSNIRVECRQLYVGFGSTLVSIVGGGGSTKSSAITGAVSCIIGFGSTLISTAGGRRSTKVSATTGGSARTESVGYNDVVALPFASANVERKTDHANQNNWQIAIFNDPLRQQTAPSPCPLGSFPHSHLHGQEKCVESKSCA